MFKINWIVRKNEFKTNFSIYRKSMESEILYEIKKTDVNEPIPSVYY